MKVVVGKMVVLGHQAVGKTSMVMRYVDNKFDQHVSPTVGGSFFTCKIMVEDEIMVKLQVWDTAGQERFKAMAPMFYRNANSALLVFDLTDENTFESIKDWITELKRNVEEPMALCVVGNKLDLTDDRKVAKEEAVRYSQSIGASYFECSAKEDQGIDQIFDNAAFGLLKLLDNGGLNSLQVYGDQREGVLAISSELLATDEGTTERGTWSISAIAHATNVRPNCC